MASDSLTSYSYFAIYLLFSWENPSQVLPFVGSLIACCSGACNLPLQVSTLKLSTFPPLFVVKIPVKYSNSPLKHKKKKTVSTSAACRPLVFHLMLQTFPAATAAIVSITNLALNPRPLFSSTPSIFTCNPPSFHHKGTGSAFSFHLLVCATLRGSLRNEYIKISSR